LSFRAFGPRNLMKVQCANGPFPRTKPFVFSSALIANIVLSTLGTGTDLSGFGNVNQDLKSILARNFFTE